MNLVACESCGVVIDKERLNFPTYHDLRDDQGEYDDTKAMWNGDNWVAFVKCPVCENPIPEKNGRYYY
jgi:RNA polymerase-binding transcription factor DksA